VAKKNGKTKSKKSFTIPLAVVGGFMPLAVGTLQTAGGWDRKLWYATQAITGYDTDTRKFWFPNLYKGAMPILVGFLVHMVASKVGVNKAIARAGIPLIRV